MKKYLICAVCALATVIIFSFTSVNDCNLLPDGLYKMEYTFNSIEKPTKILIKKWRFSECCKLGDTLRGTVAWTEGCYLIFKYDGRKTDTSGLAGMMLRSFGEHCFEIKEAIGDTIPFRTTYIGNLHITINEGRFIKIK